MSGGRAAIHARRAALVERAARERDQVAGWFEPWRGRLAAVDRGLALLASLRRNAPLIGVGLGIAATALAIARPPSIGGLLRGGRTAWTLARRLGVLL